MKNLFYGVLLLVFLGACSDELVCPSEISGEERYKWSNHITVLQAKKRLVDIVSEVNSQIPPGVNRIASIQKLTKL